MKRGGCAIHSVAQPAEAFEPAECPLRIRLGLQADLSLLWANVALFFARLIVLGEPDGPYVEKIAIHTAPAK